MKFNGVGPQVVMLLILCALIYGLTQLEPKPTALGQNIGKQVSMLTQR